MKYLKIIFYFTLPLLLTACSKEEDQAPFRAQPVDLSLCIDNLGLTRTDATPTGSVFIRTNKSDATKRYSYDSSSKKFVSDNPLVWLASTMTITGYYYQINGATTEMTFLYTVDNKESHLQTSYCAGNTTVNYPDTVNLHLRQQLAKIEIIVKADDGTGTVQSNPRLGGDLLYMTGTFDNTTFDNKGFATGGANGTGWNPSTNTNRQTIAMKTESSSDGEYKYSAIILPQTITDTSTPFFTIDIGPNSSTVLANVKYKLKTATTFKAGYVYTLSVDHVTNTLYIESGIQVEDFDQYDASRRAVSPADATVWT